MSLRRTAIARKSELRRKGELRRTAFERRKASGVKAVKAARPRDTGPPRATRAVVLDRAQGCCELCGVQLHDGVQWIRSHSVHHRRPRRAGGDPRPSTNQPSNLLLLCGDATTPGWCHQRVESNRTAALAQGWLLHAEDDPAGVPVAISPQFVRVLLDDHGNYEPSAA